MSGLLAAAAGASAQDATTPDPVDTTNALRALMAAGPQRIPRASTCFGAYGQKGAPTINDMLSVQFAYLARGANTVRGGCTGAACEINIQHANGEDVSSARISFVTRRGLAQIDTLQCVMTP